MSKQDAQVRIAQFMTYVRTVNGRKAIWKVRAFFDSDCLRLHVDSPGLISGGGCMLSLIGALLAFMLWASVAGRLQFQKSDWDPLYWTLFWVFIFASCLYSYTLVSRHEYMILKDNTLTVTRKTLWRTRTEHWNLNEFNCLYVHVDGKQCSLSMLNKDDVRAEILNDRSYYTLTLLAALIREETGMPAKHAENSQSTNESTAPSS